MSDLIVVIPTARAINLDYVSPLIDAGARFIVVNDASRSLDLRHPQFSVYSLDDRRRILGNLAHAIPHGNGSCRDFGFLLAWAQASTDDILIALDDDCAVDEGF